MLFLKKKDAFDVVWICNPDNMNIRIYNPLKIVLTAHYKC